MTRSKRLLRFGCAVAFFLAPIALLAGCATSRDDVPATTPAVQNIASTAPVGKPVAAAGNSIARRTSAASSSLLSNAKPACKVRSDSVAWEYRAGACRNGFLYGEGKAVSVDGQRHYQGGFADGAFHGQGSYDWGNGVQYTGAFVRGAKSGRGAIAYTDNRKYMGDFQDNVYHGQGVYTDADGSVYQGEFRNGRFNGRGTYTWANGDKYTGQFRDDLMEGEGAYLRANGEQYSGSFKQNEREGMGVYRWPNGDRYQGAFRGNEMNGEGTYYHADGAQYVGYFLNGKRHGSGRLVSADGEYRQQWNRGEKNAEERLPRPVEDAKAPVATGPH